MNLDDDLAAWAAATRLPDADADAIFRRIVATEPAGAARTADAAWPAGATRVLARTATGLDPAWWRRYTAGFAAGIVASTTPVRHAA
jgi:hypothetical protein